MESPHFMDYTMENPQVVAGSGALGAQPQPAQQQFHCQPAPQPGPHLNGLISHASSSRENQRYDPVYDASRGYPASSNTNTPSQNSYSAPQGSQWAAGWAPAPIQNWQSFGDVHSGGQSQAQAPAAATAYGNPQPAQRSRRLDAYFMPYVVGQPALPAHSEPYSAPADPRSLRSTMQDPSPAPHSNPPDTHRQQQYRAYQLHQLEQQRLMNGRGQQATTNPRASGTESTNSIARSRRVVADLEWASGFAAPIRQRRMNSDSDSDDDEDLLMPDEYHRSAELLFSGEDSERRAAAMRGALASSKRIPSKAAIDSLIEMTVKEIDDEGGDVNCMICYNDYGTANPEGIVEHPLRLPKCKHIFGSVCLKKWFEDADTCPYCRDKLPSTALSKSLMMDYYRASRDRERAILLQAQEYRLAQSESLSTDANHSGHGNRRMRFTEGHMPSEILPGTYIPPNLTESIMRRNDRNHARARIHTGSTQNTQQSLGYVASFVPGRSRNSASWGGTHEYLEYTDPSARHAPPASTSNTLRRSFPPTLPPPPGLNVTPHQNSSVNATPSTSISAVEASPPVAVGSLFGAAGSRRGGSNIFGSGRPPFRLPREFPAPSPPVASGDSMVNHQNFAAMGGRQEQRNVQRDQQRRSREPQPEAIQASAETEAAQHTALRAATQNEGIPPWAREGGN